MVRIYGFKSVCEYLRSSIMLNKYLSPIIYKNNTNHLCLILHIYLSLLQFFFEFFAKIISFTYLIKLQKTIIFTKSIPEFDFNDNQTLSLPLLQQKKNCFNFFFFHEQQRMFYIYQPEIQKIIQIPQYMKVNTVIQNQAPQSSNSKVQQFKIPKLYEILDRSYKDALSNKEDFFDPVFRFVEEYIKTQFKKHIAGRTIEKIEEEVNKDFQKACQIYTPVIQKIDQGKIQDKTVELPDLAADLKTKGVQTKQKFINRIHELMWRGKQNYPRFDKQMKQIMLKEGGTHFKSGYKMQKTKAYLRVITKILEDHITKGSAQVYTDFNHFYWWPVYAFFNKVMDKKIKELKIELYDLLRCKCSYKSLQEIEKVYNVLVTKYKVIRVKNRIAGGTRDILLNLRFGDSIAEVQLALNCDTSKYQFKHKLYEMMREKIGPAFCCFTMIVDKTYDLEKEIKSKPSVNTDIGLVKSAFLRETIEPGFQRLALTDALKIKQAINKYFINQWAILSLNTGTLRGKGYGQFVQQKQYGPEAGQMLIIKKK